MPRYDYGLRGPRDTTDPRLHDWSGDAYAEAPYRRPRAMPPTNRVTARYNMDYIRPTGERYPRNPNRFAGDSYGRVQGEYEYNRPYITRGGTWTHRGTMRPVGYDYPDYGPNYGGRYPDEI